MRNIFGILTRPFYTSFEFDVYMSLDECLARLSQGIQFGKNRLYLPHNQLISINNRNECVLVIIHLRHSLYGFAPASVHLDISLLDNQRIHITGKTYAHVLNCFTVCWLFSSAFIFFSAISTSDAELYCFSVLLMMTVLILAGRQQLIRDFVLDGLRNTLQQ